MDLRVKDIITIVDYIVFTIILIILAFLSGSNFLLLITYLLFLTCFTIRTYFCYEKEREIAKNILLILEVMIIWFINYSSKSFVAMILYLFLVDSIIVNFNKKQGYMYSVLVYLMNFLSAIIMLKDKINLIPVFILVTMPIYIIFIIIFKLINYLLFQNKIIEESLKEITVKKIEKDEVYGHLSEAYEKVELMTANSERNKIAREIHDTVGHTLTTVLVEMEASRRLMDKDIIKAKEKLSLAQEQVRKGLNDIRSSVRILEQGKEIMDFWGSLKTFIAECEMHSDIIVKSHIDSDMNVYDSGKKVIYRALQEGLTNGIRHGKSTAFIFKLFERDNSINFSLEDNGIGAVALTKGFGLRSMEERVKELGGQLNIYSEEGEGFSIYIKLPLVEGGKIND
ncbi:sensor histidine kinase [Clostridium intestinale]|uniref:sensor histidine kinase n=1 Tax=Clostridium intestinale TaxID=36845 RepID=UPI002DD694D7|nr:sensor histidine kinase [Clostridium intestinale]WRY51550.1 sensor histidine kinase [Clostridium intestinale]